MIDKEKIREAILKTGYLEEQKVISEFETNGFFAGANYAFEDQDEHKSREVDFIASKYTDFEFGKTGFYYYVYGEVKKRTEPIVFFERRQHPNEMLEIYVPMIATQEFFSNIDVGLNLKKILNLGEIHHQAKYDLISTQFCVIDDRNKASHKDLYETLFIPLLKCVDSEYSNMQSANSIFNPMSPSFFLHILQPILVISGPILSYDVYTDEIVEKDYLIYRRHYASKSVRRTLLIDVVSKDYLNTYISDKLELTYRSIEESYKKNYQSIIDLCNKDYIISDMKLKEAISRQGFRVGNHIS